MSRGRGGRLEAAPVFFSVSTIYKQPYRLMVTHSDCNTSTFHMYVCQGKKKHLYNRRTDRQDRTQRMHPTATKSLVCTRDSMHGRRYWFCRHRKMPCKYKGVKGAGGHKERGKINGPACSVHGWNEESPMFQKSRFLSKPDRYWPHTQKNKHFTPSR